MFYDVNANSNLRRPVAAEFGVDPFDRLARFLEERMEARAARPGTSSA